MLTYKKVNAILRDLGFDEELVKGNGELYFIGGRSYGWYSSSIPVNTLNQLSLMDVLRWHTWLSTDWRNSTAPNIETKPQEGENATLPISEAANVPHQPVDD